MSEADNILQAKDTDGMEDKYFTFWLEDQLYAIPVADVVQIVGIQPFTRIPEAPFYMKGIVNVRGSMIPVIDMRLRLGIEEKEYGDHTSIIIVNVREKQMSFVVDSVNEVTNIPSAEFTKPEDISKEYMTGYITGISYHNKQTIIHLDLNKICRDEDLSFA